MSMIHSIDVSECPQFETETELWASEFAGFFERKIDKDGVMWCRDYYLAGCNLDIRISDPDYGIDITYGMWERENLHEILYAWSKETDISYNLKFTDGRLVEVISCK